ncbi:MAG: protoporphyrinogen oxidase, partial [Candidatus Hydrogenedentes bacterium]|nr:protoporphyrinogen oxidase [Candidatus Hydrogenedentota bacterium]
MNQPIKAVVIGAGVTGLCAAHYLAKRFGRENILVLEAANHPGGTARTDLLDGYTLEWGPNGFLDKEPKTLEWIDELGLTAELIRANEAATHRFILRHGRLHEVQGPPKFLLSSLLSLSGRARLLCEPFIPGKRDATPESIWNFAARRIGREAADTLVSPMVSGIFGGDAKQLSLEHCFPRMAAMERQYGGLYKALRAKRKENPGASPMGPSGTLTCFPEGIQQLCDTAAAQLGDRLHCNAPVTSVRQDNTHFRIELNSGEILLSEKLLVAAPAYAAAQFLAPLDGALAQTLGSVPYASIAVLCTAHGRSQVAHPLNGFGFLAPRVE